MLQFNQENANSNFDNNNQIKNKFATSNDLIYFKDEILKDLKENETKQQVKLNTYKEQIKEKFQYTELEIESLKNKIFELTSKVSQINSNNELTNKISFNQSKIEEKLNTLEINIKDLNINYSDSIFTLNKLIQDKILCPGFIGVNSKFPSFYSFIDYVLNNINNLNAFRDKIAASDFKSYRTKLDIIINNMRNKIDNFVSTSNNFTMAAVEDCEKKFTKIFNGFENKIDGLKKNNSEFSENIENFKEKIKIFELNINKKIQETLNKMKNTMSNMQNNIITRNNMNENINSIQDIKNILIKMDSNIKEFTKYFNLKLNTHRELIHKLYKNEYQSSFSSENEFQKVFEKLENLRYSYNNFNKSLDLEKINELQNLKKISSAESLIKKYIEGEINLEDLQLCRKKTKHKTQILRNVKFGDENIEEKGFNYSQIIRSIYKNSNQKQEDENKNKNDDMIISDIRRVPKKSFTHFYKRNFNTTDLIPIRNPCTKINIVNLGEEENIQKISNKKIKVFNFNNGRSKQVEPFLIENENVIIKNIPRKKLIYNLLVSNRNPMSFYFFKQKSGMAQSSNLDLENTKKTDSTPKKLNFVKVKSDSNMKAKFYSRPESGNLIDMKNDLNENSKQKNTKFISSKLNMINKNRFKRNFTPKTCNNSSNTDKNVRNFYNYKKNENHSAEKKEKDIDIIKEIRDKVMRNKTVQKKWE